MAEQSFSRLITTRASACPDDAVVVSEHDDAVLTASELDRRSNRLAREYLDRGVRHDDLVEVVLPNGVEFVVACAAIWKVGATPMPMDPSAPDAERRELQALARPALSVGGTPVDRSIPHAPQGFRARANVSDAALPDAWAACWKAPTSSGSTGRPKIVKATAPALFDPAHPVAPFFPATAVQLVTAPLWHSAAFTYAFRGLITGHRLMLSEAFDELGFLRAVADHRVNWVLLSPSMIHRLVRVPTTVRGGFDLSSLTSVVHMGAPCAHADKRALIAWLGPHRVIEVYAGSESNGLTMISGTEWLRRPRSVGRGIAGTEIRIVRDDGSTAASGEAGQVWMRRGQRASYSYLGAESRRTADGWDTLGDIGRLDEDGYLTILDRANDLVVFDDHTVYPPAVEHALMQHPLVRDAVVYGADDAAGRQVLAAVVDIGDADVDPEAIQRFAAARLGPDDRPAQITLTRTPIRNQAGKVRRSSSRHNGNNRRGTAAVA